MHRVSYFEGDASDYLHGRLLHGVFGGETDRKSDLSGITGHLNDGILLDSIAKKTKIAIMIFTVNIE